MSRSARVVSLVGVVALALLGVALFESSRGGEESPSGCDLGSTSRSRRETTDTTASSTPAELVAQKVELVAPRSSSPSKSTQRVAVAPIEWPVAAFALRGRLAGLDPRVPFESPLFVIPVYAQRQDAYPGSFRRRWQYHASRPGRPVRPDADLPIEQRLAAKSAVLDTQHVSGPIPTLASFAADSRPLCAPLFHGDCFALDFQSLASPQHELELVALDVVANDPRYAARRQRVALPPHVETKGAVVDVVVQVEPTGSVSGVVESHARPADSPADSPAPPIEVGLFAAVGGVPAGEAIDVAVCPGERFRLRAAKDGDYCVVAAGSRVVPAFVLVHLAVGRETDAGALVLEPGGSIAGKVSLPNRVFRPDSRFDDEPTVYAELDERSGARLELADHALFLFNGHVLERTPTAHLEARRRDVDFVLEGLHEGCRYRVGLAPLAGATALEDVMRRATVAASCKDVALVFDAATLDVQVDSPNGPCDGAEVSIGAAKTTTGADGHATFFVAPDHEFELLGTKKSFESGRTSTRTGGPCSVARASLWLVPLPSDSSVELVVDGKGLGPLRSALVTFESPDRAVPTFTRKAALRDGAFLFESMRPGRYRATVDALELDDDAAGASPLVEGHWLVGAALDVDVGEHEQTKRRLVVARGGKLRPSASDADGAPLSATCTVRDASGAAFDVLFVVRRPVNARSSAESWSGHVAVGAQECESDRALAPGRYVATFEAAGFEPKSVEFELRAGELTDVAATLAHRR